MTLPWTGQMLAFGSAVGGAVPIQAFAELGRTTASGGETSLSVSSFANKKWLIVLYYDKGIAGAPARLMTFNSDTGTNYAKRQSSNGGVDGTTISANNFNAWAPNDVVPQFSVFFIENTSAQEKLVLCHTSQQNTAGAGNAPQRTEFVGKWADTSNPITTITVTLGSGTYASGDELVVLGADPSDTNVTPFFNELGRVILGSSNANLDITGITSKKYNFISIYAQASLNGDCYFEMGNGSFDTGTSYANRASYNGGADATSGAGTTKLQWDGNQNNGNALPIFSTTFGVNVATNEKLFIGHDIRQNTAGAGNAPNRAEMVGKWINTSVQWNQIRFLTDTGTWNTGSEMILYGAN